jgi:peptide-methionine (S)-S-oxide reductase
VKLSGGLPAVLAAAVLALTGCGAVPAQAAEAVFEAPAATRAAKEAAGLKVAIFAGGCFWGVEGVFSHMKGVKSAISGYHGGTKETADYKTVSAGTTDHAEAVRVVYDPKVVRYDQLLRVFFAVVADPTLKNRQGPDIGPQYRAALVPINDEQSAVAAAYIAQMKKSGVWDRPIVVGIEGYQAFYRAETYHQDFMQKNPDHGYIKRWDAPKVAALRSMFPDLYSATFQAG